MLLLLLMPMKADNDRMYSSVYIYMCYLFFYIGNNFEKKTIYII